MRILITTSSKTSNLQVFKKNPQIHKKTSPNSRENRKAGNTDPKPQCTIAETLHVLTKWNSYVLFFA